MSATETEILRLLYSRLGQPMTEAERAALQSLIDAFHEDARSWVEMRDGAATVSAAAVIAPRIRDVRGFLDYVVSEDGSVYSTVVSTTPHATDHFYFREVKATDDFSPYVRFQRLGGSSRRRLDLVVAIAFLPPQPTARHVLIHLDGNGRNCRADNLQWVLK